MRGNEPKEAVMLKRLAIWWRSKRDIQTLEGLDDRMLADMGLSRENIRVRVRGDIPNSGDRPLPLCFLSSWAGYPDRLSHAEMERHKARQLTGH